MQIHRPPRCVLKQSTRPLACRNVSDEKITSPWRGKADIQKSSAPGPCPRGRKLEGFWAKDFEEEQVVTLLIVSRTAKFTCRVVDMKPSSVPPLAMK